MQQNLSHKKRVKAAQAAFDFFWKKQKYDEVTKEFSKVKASFYKVMDEYFAENGIEEKVSFRAEDACVDEEIVVSRVQSSSVNFDADKLEKAIGKKKAKAVIQKRYEVTDIHGLVEYMKSLGADPEVFKSFLSVSKSVNVKELDNLEQLGEVSVEKLKGCYSIVSRTPYFKVYARRGTDDGE